MVDLMPETDFTVLKTLRDSLHSEKISARGSRLAYLAICDAYGCLQAAIDCEVDRRVAASDDDLRRAILA